MNTPLLTASQVGRELHLSAERVRQLARNGTLPPAVDTPLERLWEPEDVARFAMARRSTSSGDR